MICGNMDLQVQDPVDSLVHQGKPKGLFKKKRKSNLEIVDNSRKRIKDENEALDDTTVESVQRKKKSGIIAVQTKIKNEETTIQYEASGTLHSLEPSDMGATREIHLDDIDTEIKIRQKSLDEDTSFESASLYKGQKNYRSYLESNSHQKSKYSRIGPVKTSGNVRAISRFDYQQDICKDYKETGYCGFGDSCKFMHDRGDYKSGWELEREWNDEQKRKAALRNMPELAEQVEEVDLLPYFCMICRKDFVDPVVTKCGHYFCESCAAKRYNKTPKCYACGGPLSGSFQTAKDLILAIAKRKEKAAQAENKDQETEHINNEKL